MSNYVDDLQRTILTVRQNLAREILSEIAVQCTRTESPKQILDVIISDLQNILEQK
jgi:hypothetical protein